MPPDLTGLTRTPNGGWRVYVRVRPLPAVCRRLPPGTTQTAAVEERDRLRVELRAARKKHARLAPTSGTFAADVVRYLEAVAAMPTLADRRWQLTLWVDHFGDRPRRTITATDIRRVLAGWSGTYSPRTRNHLRGALMHLWHVLDGKSAPNPVRDVPAARLPDDLPRNLPEDAVSAILAHITPTSKVAAVLRLMRATGMTPTEVRRLQPVHDLGDALIVLGRRKGKGTRPRTLPVTPDVRAALDAVAAAAAWGGVSLRTIGTAWRRAKRLAGYADTDWRAYDLRHTYLTAISGEGDDRVTQYLAGHTTPKMTQRYTLGSVPDRVASVIATVIANRSARVGKNEKTPANTDGLIATDSHGEPGENGGNP